MNTLKLIHWEKFQLYKLACAICILYFINWFISIIISFIHFFCRLCILDGHTLVESIAIIHYLEETRPQQPLLPQDPFKRCKVRELCEIIVSGIQPLQNLGLLVHLSEEKKMNWAQNSIARGFDAIEKLLSASAGKYCVGDYISMADCCLVPQVFNAQK